MSGFLSFDKFDVKKHGGAGKRKATKDPSTSDSEDSNHPKAKAKAAAAAKVKAKAKAAAEAAKKANEPPEPQETLEELSREIPSLAADAIVRRYVRAALRDWKKMRAEGGNRLEGLSEADKAVATAAPPPEASLRPLIDLVEMRAPGDPESAKVEKVCRFSLEGNNLQAEQAYIDLTIGNVKWPIGGGNFLSSDGPQEGNRMWGQKERKVDATPSLLDDGAQKTAIQGLKRLISFAKVLEAERSVAAKKK
eukprot:TRINITY_DN68993_c0_g1_i1.p1 TRINITY_DN68993_c0_g1~~TRINITY_DN68993_c0_g1_i1.p1  ORF type:complete len:250 (+),score=86.70 TRINITY_DN68993_c0_g1_i1:69-818(+)